MQTINIGFIGGCLNKQKELARGEHYYSVLDALLKQAFQEQDFHFSFSSFLSYSELGKQTTELISKRACDIIVIFLRPFPLMPMNKILVRYKSAPWTTSLTVHPALFKRSLRQWPEKLCRYDSEGDFVFSPKLKFGLRDLNLFLGALAGLYHWSSEYIEQIVLSVNSSLVSSGKKLLVFTTPGYPSSLAGDYICRKLSAGISRLCSSVNISYVDLYSCSKGLFNSDGVHFTAEGHRFIAGQVFGKIRQMI